MRVGFACHVLFLSTLFSLLLSTVLLLLVVGGSLLVCSWEIWEIPSIIREIYFSRERKEEGWIFGGEIREKLGCFTNP